MASSGPNYAGTAANDTGRGTVAWSSPINGAANDGSTTFAQSFSSPGLTSNYLKVTNFGFSIPGGSTIDGIVVEWEGKADDFGGGSSGTDTAVRIVKGGVIGSTDKASNTVYPTSLTFKTYGGVSDLWGESWTPADINDSEFGSAISFGSAFYISAYIDTCRITVYYTAGSSGGLGPVLSGKVTSEGRIFGGSVLRC